MLSLNFISKRYDEDGTPKKSHRDPAFGESGRRIGWHITSKRKG